MSQRKYNQNSSEAYKSLDPDSMRQIYKDILFALGNMPEGATYEQLAQALKVKESRVWKRLGEMSDMQLIHRDGRRMLSSNRMGSIWKKTVSDSAPSTPTRHPKGKNASEYAVAIIQQSILF
jgi:hypothetical protein